jgi:hypothetical protein
LGGLEAGMRKMNMTISDGLAGNKTAVETFQKLGISVDSLRGMNADQRFMAIAKAIALIPDPADRAAAAVDILGRSGVDLIPLIDSLKSMPDMKIPKLSEEELKNLDAAKAAIEVLDLTWENLKNTFASTMFPSFTPFIEDLTGIVNAIKWLMEEWNKLPPDLKKFIGTTNILNVMTSPLSFLPKTASGGVVTSPQVRMVGEAGPEAIIPLSQMGGMGGGVTVNVGNYMGDEISKRALVRDIQRILNEESRRSITPSAKTDYYSVGGHL